MRDLTIVIDPRTMPLPRTAKHTIIRPTAWRQFASEIEQVYAAIENDDALGQALLSPDNVRGFVRETVNRLMDVPVVHEDRDLFVQGCDRYDGAIYVITYRVLMQSCGPVSKPRSSDKPFSEHSTRAGSTPMKPKSKFRS